MPRIIQCFYGRKLSRHAGWAGYHQVVAESEIVSIISAESQESVEIDATLVGAFTWPKGVPDATFPGPGTKRWLTGSESDALREALLSVTVERESASINAAVDLIDYAVSTGTGVGVIIP